MEIKNFDFNFGQEQPETDILQESYDAGSSSYRDIFDEKFNSFDPANIVSGNNSLKSGQFPDMTEAGPNAIEYKKTDPFLKGGKFFD